MGCGDHGNSVVKEILKVLLSFFFARSLHQKKKKKPLNEAQFQKEDK